MRNSGENSPMFNKIYICSYTPNGLLIVFLFQLHSQAYFSEIVRIVEHSDTFPQN